MPLDGEVAPANDEEAIEEFRRLFYEAVRLRLHGDVEVGAYVSGGLDSTSVASAAAEVSGRPIKAFTVEFEDKKLNEGQAAAEFAQAGGFEHHTVRIGPGDLAPHFERSLWHSEIVVSNSHGAAKMILSELARRHVKVVLTGEGADEALAGYNVFQHLAQLEEVRTHPKDRGRRAALDALLRKEQSGIALLNSGILPIRALPEYDRIVGLFGAYPYAIARAMRTAKKIPFIMSSDFRREVAGIDPVAAMAERIGRGRMASLSPVAAHQYYLFKADLPAYILNCLGDRVEMAHSIEGRVPFLDHKLVEFAFSLPVSLKLRDGAGKYVLRRAIAERLPSALQVKKRPFVAGSSETLGLNRNSEFCRALFGQPRHPEHRLVQPTSGGNSAPQSRLSSARLAVLEPGGDHADWDRLHPSYRRNVLRALRGLGRAIQSSPSRLNFGGWASLMVSGRRMRFFALLID